MMILRMSYLLIMQLFFLRHIASFTITRCSFTSCPRRKLRFCSHIPDEGDTEEVVRIEKSVVKVDDGGSDLTDRFKYKVHALMGDFDPPSPDTDNENVDGNILSAILNFPCKYDFNVVGKTVSDDSSETYASVVQRIVRENTGDEKIQCRIKPRGQNYVKLTLTATVESSAMISTVLNQIAELDQTVMRF